MERHLGARIATDEIWIEPDPGFGSGSGIGGFEAAFGAFFVLAVVIGIAATAYRIWMARDMAKDAGLDPNHATAMTLLTGDEGLSATYLASSLRTPPTEGGDKEEKGPEQSVADRLRALQQLRDDGLITTAEYDERRARILDDL